MSSPRRLADRLLGRLIWNPSARSWIALVAFALIGIVAMQLWVVKLSVGIGRALEHTALLQRENSGLSIEASTRSSGERIERLAAAQGMTIAPPGALHFERVREPFDARLAAAALTRPAQAQTAGAAAVETGAGATATTAALAPGSPAAGEATTQAAGTETAASPAAAAPAQSPSTTAAGETATTATQSAGGAAQATPTAAATAPGAGGASTSGASQAPGASPAGSGGGTQAAPGG